MRSVAVASLFAAVAYGQATFNQTTGKFTCAIPNGEYCAGDSLSSNIIIRCSNGVGQPGNCNDNLAGVPPVGVKTSALCYQTSANAGDAACSFNGIAYPDSGSPFSIPGSGASYSASSTSYSASSTSSSYSASSPSSYSASTPSSYSVSSSSSSSSSTTSCSTTLATSSSTPCTTSTSSIYSSYSASSIPPYQTINSTVTISVGPTGTGSPSGTGYPTGTGASTTWSATATPTPPPFTGAGSQLFVSSSMALLPVVGFLAYWL